MNINNIDWNKLVVPALEESKKQPGFKSCNPTYEGKPLQIQTGISYLPFGASPPNPEKKILKWSLPIARDHNGKPFSAVTATMFGKLEAFDQWVIQYIFENPLPFFGVAKKRDIVEEFYNKTSKYDKKPENAAKYGPRFSPVLPFVEETKAFKDITCLDVNGTPIGPENIKRGTQAIIIYELASIYSVAGKACGATWNVRSIRIVRHASNEAPAIDISMYGEEAAFEQALLELPIPEGGTIKRDREEEEEDGLSAHERESIVDPPPPSPVAVPAEEPKTTRKKAKK